MPKKDIYSYNIGKSSFSSRINNFVKRNPILQNIVKTEINNNVVLIVLDELVAYHNLPEPFLKLLNGYQLISKMGIEFTNIHNNRQQCSASRSSYTTSQINTGIQDNIDTSYQYTYVDSIKPDFDTIGKSLKTKFGSSIFTAQFGKDHLQSKLSTTINFTPVWNINTSGCLKQYGIDRYNVFGDTYYNNNKGFFSDNLTFQSISNNNIINVDYIDTTTGTGYIGALPFLKTRARDNKHFFLNVNFTNPHDTQEFWSNLSQTPSGLMLPFWCPYLDEQLSEIGKESPYKYSEEFTDAYCKNINLTTNYFNLLYPNQETSYDSYKNNLDSLPFKNSYENDYVMSSNTNALFPYFIGSYQNLTGSLTMPNDVSDIKSWKNLINNYYGLIYEVDIYIYKLLSFLKQNNMLQNTSIIITTDHGDSMSSHGLRQKQTHYKESVNVPFIVYSPYLNKNIIGKKSNILGSLLDLAPTINALSKNDINTNFSGESLLNWNNSELEIRTKDIPVLNVYNSWMSFSSAYISYSIYAEELTQEELDKIVRKPNGYLEFICNFIMTIGYYEGKLYKFVRYYNLYEVLRYNSLHNSVLITELNFTCIESDFQIRYIQDSVDETFQTTYSDEILFIIDTLTLNDTNLGKTDFTTIYNLIYNDENDIDHLALNTFVYLCVLYINKSGTAMSYIIPGRYSSYSDIKDNTHYYHFCHNITDDPDEIINMYDSKNYNESYDTIFDFFHNQINTQINYYNMDNYSFVIPQPIMYMFLSGLKSYGTNYSTYSKEDLDNLTTNGMTNEGYVPYG